MRTKMMLVAMVAAGLSACPPGVVQNDGSADQAKQRINRPVEVAKQRINKSTAPTLEIAKQRINKPISQG